MPPPPLPANTLFASAYHIFEVLAEGDASTVYVALQLSNRKLRALKLLHPPAPLNEVESARFMREEARVSSLIESAHVVEGVASGVAEGVPWLAMELLRGEPLDALIRRDGPLAQDVALELLAQIGRALDAAHAVGVVHGHLTPGHIFIAAPGSAGGSAQVKVLGFGTARLTASWTEGAAMEMDAVKARLAWLAPEQTRSGRLLAPAADIWSLGLLAFLMLTGGRYWKNTSAGELLKNLLTEPLAAASERARRLGVSERWPRSFDAWFERCVNRDPGARFFNAAEAVEGLVETFAHGRDEEPLGGDRSIVFPPGGSSYDDGVEDTSEEGEPDLTGDVQRGEGPYRKGVRPPEKRQVGPVVRREEKPVLMMGNPKGSFYDRGLQDRRKEEVGRKRRVLPGLAIGLAMVLAALWLLIFRR